MGPSACGAIPSVAEYSFSATELGGRTAGNTLWCRSLRPRGVRAQCHHSRATRECRALLARSLARSLPCVARSAPVADGSHPRRQLL
eukprot:6375272-Prymnesium_polylepis.2